MGLWVHLQALRRGIIFVTFCSCLCVTTPFQKGFHLEGKNLLLEEQTLSVKNRSSLRKGGKNEKWRGFSP